MAYQQSQVLCQPNAWTQITQYRQTRKSLMVQCPQVAMVSSNGGSIVPNDSVVRQILPADPLRARLVISKIELDASTTSYRVFPAADNGGGTGASASATIVSQAFDTGIGEMAAQAWSAQVIGNNTHGEAFYFIVETYQCAGIILATTQNPAVSGGPYGSQPPGIWAGPDFGSGPTIFELPLIEGDESLMQQWYCWPVGSVTVNVTVTESWEIDQPPPVPEKFVGILPKLSPSAMDALNDLLARTADVPQDETATD